MSSAAEEVMRCAAKGCPKTIPNHKWGRLKSGWFEQRDGTGATVWCPDHIPDWVAAWRASRVGGEQYPDPSASEPANPEGAP